MPCAPRSFDLERFPHQRHLAHNPYMPMLRRRVETPALIGRTFEQAAYEADRRLLHLDAVDGRGVPREPGARLVVIRQDPAPGTPLRRRQHVSVWLEEGGAGVREPRNPLPPTPHLEAEAEPDD